MTAASYRRVLGAHDRVGIGVSGFGLIGKQHVADLKKFKDVELLGLCDVYKPRLDEGLAYMESPNAKGYGDFRKLYENKDIQGVVIATPDHWHALQPFSPAPPVARFRREADDATIDEGKWMAGAGVQPHRGGTQRRHGSVREPGRWRREPSGRSTPFAGPRTGTSTRASA
jgi:hypothetical protein